jgi:dihydrofolate reductase
MIKMIIAVDDTFAIGNSSKEHGLPWESIAEDFKHFQYETKLLEWIVMGVTTFEFIKKISGGRLLPKRKILVISRTLTETPHPDVVLCASVEEVITFMDGKDFMVGGGKQTYESFLPRMDEIILTRVHGSFAADCYMGKDMLNGFKEDESRRKLLRPASDALPEVTAHYFRRNNV